MDFREVNLIKAALEDKKANDIKILDVSELTTICDYMIIADASNVNLLDTLVDEVYNTMAKEEKFPKMTEGNKNSGWVLMDYNDIIVQLFITDSRHFYDLERIWCDAKEI
ncbi:MAG: ribosome silencing factor [Lachnospiraceae bacterium]|nr:ribosome silencing factor [Lachnospiraceae bacterium]